MITMVTEIIYKDDDGLNDVSRTNRIVKLRDRNEDFFMEVL